MLAIGGGVVGLITAAGTIAVTVGRPLRKLSRQNDEFRADWYGEAARPGRAAIPGVPERLALIERELRPNGGGSLRDGLMRVEARLNEHIASHPGMPAGSANPHD